MRILYNSSRDMIHRVVVFLYVTYDSLFRSLDLFTFCQHAPAPFATAPLLGGRRLHLSSCFLRSPFKKNSPAL